jgi:hypothetical protein
LERAKEKYLMVRYQTILINVLVANGGSLIKEGDSMAIGSGWLTLILLAPTETKARCLAAAVKEWKETRDA